MKRIYKYDLNWTGCFTNLPEVAEVLSVQMQGESLRLWAIVDPSETNFQRRTFEIFGTGHDMDDRPRKYLGAVQQAGGALVWHVFERTGP